MPPSRSQGTSGNENTSDMRAISSKHSSVCRAENRIERFSLHQKLMTGSVKLFCFFASYRLPVVGYFVSAPS